MNKKTLNEHPIFLDLRIPVPEQIVCLCDPSYSDSQLNCASKYLTKFTPTNLLPAKKSDKSYIIGLILLYLKISNSLDVVYLYILSIFSDATVNKSMYKVSLLQMRLFCFDTRYNSSSQ